MTVALLSALPGAQDHVQIGPVQLILGDCLEVLPGLRGVADLICTDAPYKLTSGGQGEKGDGSMSGMFGADAYDNSGNLFAEMAHWREMGGPLYRAAKPQAQAYIMAEPRNLSAAQEGFLGAGWRFHNTLVWVKDGPTPNRQYMKRWEGALYLFKGTAKTIANPGDSNVFTGPRVPPKSKIHETEKPVWLLKRWIANSCRPGGLVLDPFAGSASTLVAAAECGCRAIGIEKDPKYFYLAKARLKNEAANWPNLGEAK